MLFILSQLAPIIMIEKRALSCILEPSYAIAVVGSG
jgi:hypothetical protein